MTEHLVLAGEERSDDDAIARTAEALARGFVVAVPTDTVYGLACRSAFPESVQRIYALKGRPSDKALPWLVPDVDAAFGFVNVVPPRAMRLMQAFWPGALTIVLGEGKESVALRLPDHDALRDILRQAGGPVVATSANLSGFPPAVTAAAVAAAFGDRLDVVLDGGPARLGGESTIVEVRPDGGFAMLRAGAIPESALRPVLATRVLFVCTGNTCRSPMAEALLVQALSTRLKTTPNALESAGFVVRSAGIYAAPGAPASPGARSAGRHAGLDLADHRAAAVTADDIETADFVFAMAFEHLVNLRRHFGRPAEAAQLLDPSGSDVADPFGGPPSGYEAALKRITTLIESRLPAIVAHGVLATAKPS